MLILDIPNETTTDQLPADAASRAVAVANALAMTKQKPPLVQVSVNGDDAIIEAVGLIRSARTQMELLTNTINDRLNLTFSDVGDKITNIITNVDTITDNIAHSSNNLNQPILFMLFMCVLLLIFVVVLLFIILKTRREYKKHRTRRRSNSTNKLPYNSGRTSTGRNSARGIANRIRKHFRRITRPENECRNSSIPGPITIAIGGGAAEDYRPSAPSMVSSMEYSNAPTLPKKSASDTIV